MTRQFTIAEIKQTAGQIAEQHGVERMFLFGSYARGDAKPGSDLDFRIDRGKVRGLFALGSLYADLEAAFRLPIDLVISETLPGDFRKRIESEEVVVYEQAR